MIGGQGADAMEGGTGDDQTYGDGSEEIGGLPDGDLNHASDDVLVGDVLNNGFEFTGREGDARPTVTLAGYGADTASVPWPARNHTTMNGSAAWKEGG